MSQDYDIDKVSPRPWSYHNDENEDGDYYQWFTDSNGVDFFYFSIRAMTGENVDHVLHCVNFYERIKDWCLDRDMVPQEGEDFLDVIDRMNNTLIEALENLILQNRDDRATEVPIFEEAKQTLARAKGESDV